MIVLECYDDLDWARDQTKTLAAHQDVPASWAGKSVTVDLSESNYQRVASLMSEVIQAGRPAGTQAKAAGRPRTARGAISRAHGRRSAAYYQDLRAYTDANKITKRDGSGRPAYASASPGKAFDYPDWLVTEYDEFLARQNPAA